MTLLYKWKENLENFKDKLRFVHPQIEGDVDYVVEKCTKIHREHAEFGEKILAKYWPRVYIKQGH
jgi:hypothetical protein